MLAEEHSLGLADLAFVAPEVQQTLGRLHIIVKKRDSLMNDKSLDAAEKNEQVCFVVVEIVIASI